MGSAARSEMGRIFFAREAPLFLVNSFARCAEVSLFPASFLCLLYCVHLSYHARERMLRYIAYGGNSPRVCSLVALSLSTQPSVGSSFFLDEFVFYSRHMITHEAQAYPA